MQLVISSTNKTAREWTDYNDQNHYGKMMPLNLMDILLPDGHYKND